MVTIAHCTSATIWRELRYMDRCRCCAGHGPRGEREYGPMNVASIFRTERRRQAHHPQRREPATHHTRHTQRDSAPPIELAERPEMHATLARYRRVAHIAERAGVTDVLPSGLVPATGRSSGAAAIDAVGYIDLHSQSVGVDIACWHTPPAHAAWPAGKPSTWPLSTSR